MSTTPFLSLHALHAVPASLLNRDDTGAAKTIHFGGVLRSRVSSQSWKRALRVHTRTTLAGQADFATRTRHLPDAVADVLSTVHGRDRDVALSKTVAVFDTLVGVDGKTGRTQVALFVPESAAGDIAAVLHTHWDAVGDTVPDTVLDAATAAFDTGGAVDLALYGRMLAAPAGKRLAGGRNVDAACAVAHAFSVDPARVAPDFFTTVDDYAPDTGARTDQSMLGHTDLAAPVLYRHAALDARTLTGNLAGAPDPAAAAAAATRAFVEAFTLAVPAAKRSSTAAQTLPTLVLAVLSGRDVSLADAYTSAITSTDVLPEATTRLLRHATRAMQFLPAGARAVALPVTGDLPSEFTGTIPVVQSLTDLAGFAEGALA